MATDKIHCGISAIDSRSTDIEQAGFSEVTVGESLDRPDRVPRRRRSDDRTQAQWVE